MAAGEILGVVGESGAGKSFTGTAITGLLERPGRIGGGEIRFEGSRIDNLPPERMRRLRGSTIAAIFQDPLTSLNPLFTVGRQLVETIRTHLDLGREQARRRAVELLAEVGIPAPDRRIDHYPHQFSGGMRQRVVIALCASPKLVVADEPGAPSIRAAQGRRPYADIHARGSTVEFWRAEARLALLERLKSGVTTAVSLLGGGDDVYRTDDPVYGDAHCDATRESGLRAMLAVGPGRRLFPHRFHRPDGQVRHIALTFECQMEVREDLIQRRNDFRDDRTGVCLIMPVYHAEALAEARAEIAAMAEAVADLRARYDTLFTQDGHRSGTIAIARELGLLGPFALLSHSVDLTPSDFAALIETGPHVVHNPSAIMSIHGRCPAPELIEKGVTVCLGSDVGAPDRGFDMLRHMAQCMHYHRRHFRDPSHMPPGKVLEIETIDAAHALGAQDDLGSLEAGKKADIVLVDMRKPHLWPPNMPVTASPRIRSSCSKSGATTRSPWSTRS